MSVIGNSIQHLATSKHTHKHTHITHSYIAHLISMLSGMKVVLVAPLWRLPHYIWCAAVFLVIWALKQDMNSTEMHLHLTYFRIVCQGRVWGRSCTWTTINKFFVVIAPAASCTCKMHLLLSTHRVLRGSSAQWKMLKKKKVENASCTLFLRHKKNSRPQRRHFARNAQHHT